MFDIIHVDETDSTNRWLRDYALRGDQTVGTVADKAQGVVVVAENQTAGRGCGVNTWESERGKNLTFSVLIHPLWVMASQQFVLSMVISNALRRALQPLLHQRVEVKWPNDIYVNDSKLCGILIENKLKGDIIKDCIMGIGLNVNQTVFRSDAPNPVSLLQLRGGGELDRNAVLNDVLSELERIMNQWDAPSIRAEYREHLYRSEGLHDFCDANGQFAARLLTVEDDGHLLLQDTEGQQRRYAFKEVQYII